MKTTAILFAIGISAVCLTSRVEADALGEDNTPSLERIVLPTVENPGSLPGAGSSEAQSNEPTVEPNPLPGFQQADPGDPAGLPNWPTCEQVGLKKVETW